MRVVENQLVLANGAVLERASDETHYGLYRDVPVAVSAFSSNDNVGIVIQARHSALANSLGDPRTWNWAPVVARRLESRKADLAVADRIIWLTIYDRSWSSYGMGLEQYLDALIDALSVKVAPPRGGVCHYCRRITVEKATFQDGRVGLICGPCLADRRRAQFDASPLTLRGGLLCSLATVVMAPVGGAVWAALMLTEEWVVRRFNAGRPLAPIVAPIWVELILCGIFGAVLCVPAALVIRCVRDRGRRFAIVATWGGEAAALMAGLFMIGLWMTCGTTASSTLASASTAALGWIVQLGTPRMIYIAVGLILGGIVGMELVQPRGNAAATVL